MSLESHSSKTKRCFFFILLYIIINKMKQHITENEENLFLWEKCPGVSSDLKNVKRLQDNTSSIGKNHLNESHIM